MHDSTLLFFPSVRLGVAERSGLDIHTAFPILMVHSNPLSVDTIARISLLLGEVVLHGDREGGTAGSYATGPFVSRNFAESGVNGSRILLVLQAAAGVPDNQTLIRVLSAKGAVVFAKRLDLPRRPVTDDEWDDLLDRWSTFYAKDVWSTKSLALAGLKKALVRSPFHPLVTDAVLGKDGTVWLRLEKEVDDSATWMVLDSRGKDVGSIRLPKKQRVIAATRHLAVATFLDGDDIPHLVKFGVK